MSDEENENGTPLHGGSPHARTCGAKRRDGTPCRNTAVMPNGRCRMHGGSTPIGPALPYFKHGLYSKMFPRDMRVAYKRVREHPELLSLADEIAGQTVKMQAVFAKMDETNPPPWGEAVETANDCAVELRRKKPDMDKLRAAFEKHFQVVRTGVGADANLRRLWAEFRELALEKEKLVTAERNWLAKLRSMYTAEQGLALQYAVIEAAKRTFGDMPDRLGDYLDVVVKMLDDPKQVKAVEE